MMRERKHILDHKLKYRKGRAGLKDQFLSCLKVNKKMSQNSLLGLVFDTFNDLPRSARNAIAKFVMTQSCEGDSLIMW